MGLCEDKSRLVGAAGDSAGGDRQGFFGNGLVFSVFELGLELVGLEFNLVFKWLWCLGNCIQFRIER